MDNIERADRAERALDYYLSDVCRRDADHIDADAMNLVVELLHLLRREGMQSPDTFLHMARIHFEAEVNGDE